MLPRRLLLIGALFFFGCPTPAPPAGPEWSVVFRDLSGALVSVWGSSATDVWAVGGDPGDGSGPMVLHFDGAGWTRYRTGTTGDLWWVFGFAGGPVFTGGTNGTILRWDAATFTPVAMTTPGTNTVFGIWGASPNDVWAVGGAGPDSGFAWRFDGVSWTAAAGLPADLGTRASLFKVWGLGADDVWLVGTGGVTLHWDGLAIAEPASPTTRTLFTVQGSSGLFAAVGGYGTGVVLENDGAGWQDVTPPFAPQLNGVALSGTLGYAAGINGAIYRRAGGAWEPEPTQLDVFEDFHAVWLDPDGGVWAAGGQLVLPLIRGMLVHRGTAVPGGTYQER